MNRKIEKVAIFPWAEDSSNPYQNLMARGFADIGVEVVKPIFKHPFPIYQGINQCFDADAIFFDWLHTVYTSRSFGLTLIKTVLGEIERFKIKRHQLPLIWNLHNLHRHDKLYLPLERWSFKRLARVVDGIRVFNEESKFAAEEYLSIDGFTEIRSIPHGNYIDVLNKYPKRSIRELYQLDKNDFVLLVFGGIREGKGILKFMRTFIALKSLDIKVIVAGKPDSKEIAEELRIIAEQDSRIKLDLQYIPEEKIPSLFSSADFVVLPYEYILNSGSAILAMSAGKPILASKIPVFQEVLENNFSILGNLYNKDNLKEILLRAKNVPNREEMGVFALKKAELLSWNNIARELCVFAETKKQ